MTKKIKGFVIFQKEPLPGTTVKQPARVLTKDLYWYPHDSIEEAYVFTAEGLQYVRNVIKNAQEGLKNPFLKKWVGQPPAAFIPAEYDPNTGKTSITGAVQRW